MTKTNTTIDFHPEHSEERNDFPFDLPYGERIINCVSRKTA